MAKGVSRRRILAAGLLGAVPATGAAAAVIRGEAPWTGGAAAPEPVAGGSGYVFFTEPEAAFVAAAAERLIPSDELGPGAVDAGALLFIDRQLAGDFGLGTRWYMQGPWPKGVPTQGYQTRLSPAAMYRAAIRAIDEAVGRTNGGKRFADLKADGQDAFLSSLEAGKADLGAVDGKAFFEVLLQNVVEGFWSDPIYGGNRDMAGWKLIGFPGARYDNAPYVSRHGERYPLPPVGLKGRPDWTRR